MTNFGAMGIAVGLFSLGWYITIGLHDAAEAIRRIKP